ncbi:MAG: ABC transporter permease [Acidobacteriota bacterium]
MITAILRVSWWTLVRDRVALGLTFVLPIAFFSIFAAVFSAMDPDSQRPVEVTVVAGGEGFAAAIASRLAEQPRLQTTRWPETRLARALDAVRRGRTSAVVVLPASLTPFGTAASIEIHADRSDPLASGVVQGLVQAAAAAVATEGFGVTGEVVPLRVVDALGRTGKRPSIAFFAAGLGVMFLMLAAAGRSSILLDERDSGVLSRLMAARIGLVRLLAGHWIFLTALGAAQVALMFLWAALFFGLDLFTPRAVGGFAVTTVAAAAAAAAFGLLLCSLCRTRAQLSGITVVVILTLCALGGNLFPAFLMPEPLQAVGRLTFNHWALTAYQKIFWYERPLLELWPQLAGLTAAATAFFAAAALIAHRWLRRGGLQT